MSCPSQPVPLAPFTGRSNVRPVAGHQLREADDDYPGDRSHGPSARSNGTRAFSGWILGAVFGAAIASATTIGWAAIWILVVAVVLSVCRVLREPLEAIWNDDLCDPTPAELAAARRSTMRRPS